MSLVGPRPEDPRYVASYTPDQRKVLAVKPGLTSPATLKHRHEEESLMGPTWEDDYRARILPEKLAIDLDYFRRRTVADDVRVLARTFVALVGGRRKADANGGAPWRT
jgi:lipopolysaccharide/colanic/teichoic acid biosynthesis glycosyltransferase